MKRVLLLSLCVLVLSGLAGCREKRSVSFENDISEEIIDNSTESQISAGELEKTEITDKSAIDGEKEYMKLYFNDEKNLAALAEIRSVLKDKDEFYRRLKKVNNL